MGGVKKTRLRRLLEGVKTTKKAARLIKNTRTDKDLLGMLKLAINGYARGAKYTLSTVHNHAHAHYLQGWADCVKHTIQENKRDKSHWEPSKEDPTKLVFVKQPIACK